MDTNQIINILKKLDDFAANTSLPRVWHAQWQQLFERVQQQLIAEIEPEKGLDAPN